MSLIHKPEPTYKGLEGYREQMAGRMYTAHENARAASAAARASQADYYNIRTKKRHFQIGDHVYLNNAAKGAARRKGTDEYGNEDSRKFRMAWLGPYKIIARKGEVVYRVQHLESGGEETVHADRMKMAYDRHGISGEESEEEKEELKRKDGEPLEAKGRLRDLGKLQVESSDSESESEEDGLEGVLGQGIGAAILGQDENWRNQQQESSEEESDYDRDDEREEEFGNSKADKILRNGDLL